MIITILILIGGMINESGIMKTDNNNLSNQQILTLKSCIDGDTMNFNEIGKVRLYLVDTPESTNKKEKYGKEASKFTCDLLKNANTITYENDKSNAEYDKYDRRLLYVFVNGNLLQEELAKAGYLKKFYKYPKTRVYRYETKIYNEINDKYKLWQE